MHERNDEFTYHLRGSVGAELRLLTFVRDNPLPIVAIDADGLVRMSSAAFDAIFAFPDSEIVGEHLDARIGTPTDALEALALDQVSRQGDSAQVVTRCRRKDGAPVDVEVTVVPLTVDQVPVGAYRIYRDLTAQKRAERHLAAQYTVVKALAEAPTLMEAAPHVLKALVGQVEWTVGVLWVLDRTASKLRAVDFWHVPDHDVTQFERATRDARIDVGTGLPGRIWAAGRPTWVVDVVRDEQFVRGPSANESGLHTAYGFPVVAGGQVTAVIELLTTLTLQPDDHILQMVTAVACQLSAFVERARAQNELQRFFDMSIDMLCIAGFDGFFKRMNGAWEQVLGYTRADLLRAPYMDFVHPDDREATEAAGAKLAAGENLLSFENRYRCSDGSYKWLHWAAIAVPDRQMIYAVARDETDRRNASQQMAEALKMKSDFVSFVTHQLRTPLSGIKWMLELAEEAADLDETRSYIQDASDSANRLIALVNDLLAASRLESGKLSLVLTPVDVRQLTDSVLGDVATLVREKAHRLVVDACNVQPIVADVQLLRQVVVNLVSNAIKYTPPGGDITIGIREDNGAVHWEIRDTGIGIAPAAQSRLFQKFYRASNALTVDTEGTGLGLYLVRLIVERFGGRITCVSEEGKGTTFSVTLPTAQAA